MLGTIKVAKYLHLDIKKKKNSSPAPKSHYSQLFHSAGKLRMSMPPKSEMPRSQLTLHGDILLA